MVDEEVANGGDMLRELSQVPVLKSNRVESGTNPGAAVAEGGARRGKAK